MRGQLSNAAITTLVISCLLITFDDHPKDLTALMHNRWLKLPSVNSPRGIFCLCK